MPSLIVVGSGIKSVAHLTEETKRVIQKADKVLYLINENNLKAWIQREAKNSESLEFLYFNHTKRTDAYYSITQYIIDEYYRINSLCVVFYGHPTVFAESALSAVKIIKAENGNATILPAVSSMDCLFSDLQIDPGDHGCFSVDATELLLYEKIVDVSAHIILWQIANLGMHDVQHSPKLNVLIEYLENFYDSKQNICIYEAAIFPMQKPRIEWISLFRLNQNYINPYSTIYIPPVLQKNLSKKYLNLLQINIEDYSLSSDLDASTK